MKVKSLLALCFALALTALPAYPQGVKRTEIKQSSDQHTLFDQATAAATIDFRINNGITSHALTYKTTGFSALTVTFSASVDGSSYSTLGTSTTTGGATITSTGTYTYGRIAYSGLTGSGTIDADYYGNVGDLQLTSEQWLAVTPSATADSGKGAVPGSWISDNSSTSTVVKSSPGVLYSLTVSTTLSAAAYVRAYNATSATCNSATGIVQRFIIPAASTGAGGVFTYTVGAGFSAGIVLCMTTNISDTGTTAAGASVLVVSYSYK